jgi:hypothetical protein
MRRASDWPARLKGPGQGFLPPGPSQSQCPLRVRPGAFCSTSGGAESPVTWVTVRDLARARADGVRAARHPVGTQHLKRQASTLRPLHGMRLERRDAAISELI